MRAHFFICALLLLSWTAQAQIDSLDTQLDSKPLNEQKVDWLLEAIKGLQRTDPLTMEHYASKALALSKEIDYPKGAAYAHHLIGISFEMRNEYQQAAASYLQAYNGLSAIGEELGAARVAVNMGNVYDMLENVPMAKSYILSALPIIERLGSREALTRTRLNLGVVYFNEGQYDSAQYYFERIKTYRESINDSSGLALINLNLANVYEFQGDLAKARGAYLLARVYVSDNDMLIANIYCGIGSIMLKLTSDLEGTAYLDSCRQAAIANGQTYEEMIAVSYYREHFERLDDLEEAYPYLMEEYEMDGEIRGEQVQKEVEVMRLKYDGEKKARELAELNVERAEQAKYLLMVVGGLILIVLIASTAILLLRLRVKNEKRKSREIQKELDHKTQELTAYTLNFIQKNELLSELTDKVNQLKSSEEVRSTSTDKGLTQLNNLIMNSMRIDQDWENFRKMFEDIHPDFNYRLKSAFPDIGNAELKLCALLRLNLNLKESSKILGISSDSVKTARSRLRKKLGLVTEDNLVDFLIKFDGKTPAEMLN